MKRGKKEKGGCKLKGRKGRGERDWWRTGMGSKKLIEEGRRAKEE